MVVHGKTTGHVLLSRLIDYWKSAKFAALWWAIRCRSAKFKSHSIADMTSCSFSILNVCLMRLYLEIELRQESQQAFVAISMLSPVFDSVNLQIFAGSARWKNKTPCCGGRRRGVRGWCWRQCQGCPASWSISLENMTLFLWKKNYRYVSYIYTYTYIHIYI